jgi:hypothetical protein
VRLLALLVLAAGAHAQVIAKASDYPKPGEHFRQPVTIRAAIIQGNGGEFSHQADHTRFAWDYGVLPGTKIVAARSGVVSRVKRDSNVGGPERELFQREGNYVLVDHLDGTSSLYSHLQRDSVPHIAGDWVIQGEVIGRSGDSGWTSYPHLHYTVLATRSGASIASKFADFKGGVPRKGDLVAPAAKPKLPQKTIDAYRRLRRRGNYAFGAGYHALTWRIAHEFPAAERVEGYYYERRRAQAETGARAGLMAALTEEQPNRAAYRMAIVLEKTTDQKIKKLRDQLANKLGDLDAWRPWVAGLEARCDGRWADARRHFADALGRCPAARRAMQSELRSWATRLTARLQRIQLEAGIVRAQQSRRVLDDLQAWLREVDELKEFRSRVFPDEKREATLQNYAFREQQEAVVQVLAKNLKRQE